MGKVLCKSEVEEEESNGFVAVWVVCRLTKVGNAWRRLRGRPRMKAPNGG